MKLKCFFAAGFLLFTAATTPAKPKEIVVASVGQFKNAKSTANQIRTGAQIYLDAVNERGGVHGAKLRLVLQDRGPDGPDSVLKTREVIAEHRPIALLGISGTTPMEALVQAKVLEQAGIPLVGVRTGAISLHQPVHPWIFHTRANYAEELRRISKHLFTIGLKSVAVFHENSAFGREGLAHAESELKTHGLHLAGTAAYEVGTSNVTGAVASLSKLSPDAVIAVATSTATAEFYRSIRLSGSSAFVVAISVTDGAEVVKLLGNRDARGLGISQVSPDPASAKYPLARELRDAHQRFGSATELNVNVMEGYIAARVLVEALRRAGANPTSGRLRDSLESLKDFSPGGYRVSFSPTSHSGSSYVEISVTGPNGKMLR